jgi:hypothetical protein
MLSDEVLSMYMKGEYTNLKHNTYMLPPTYSMFEKVSSDDYYK